MLEARNLLAGTLGLTPLVQVSDPSPLDNSIPPNGTVFLNSEVEPQIAVDPTNPSHAVAIWQRSEPRLGEFDRTPSEQAAAQLRFTPYPFEDVGWMCAQSDPSVFLFSSDYPHPEGGRDPLGRFESSIAHLPEAAKDRFYARNFEDMMGG